MQVATVPYGADDAPQRFVQALQETGFAVLEDHPIEARRFDELTRAWSSFFASDAKYDYLHAPGTDARSGFWPAEESETAVGHQHRDLKEFFQLLADSEIPATLRDEILSYRLDALRIGVTLLSWIDDAIEASGRRTLEAPLAELVSDEESVLRVLHYPPLGGKEPPGAVRAAAHEDINLITLLPVTREPGLEALDRHGRWHPVHGEPGQLIVNAGDMLQEATDHWFPSTTHQVVNPGDGDGNQSRISIPFFIAPRLSIRLSERYTAGSYLEERLRAITGAAEASAS